MRRIDSYRPRQLSVEEFETLTALTYCLFPNRRSEPPSSLAASFDNYLHENKREHFRLADLPLDIEAIRSGLRLLNFDALARHSRSFSSLGAYQQETVLQTVVREGDAHWPQFPAGRWYKQILSVTACLFMAADSFAEDWVQRTA